MFALTLEFTDVFLDVTKNDDLDCNGARIFQNDTTSFYCGNDDKTKCATLCGKDCVNTQSYYAYKNKDAWLMKAFVAYVCQKSEPVFTCSCGDKKYSINNIEFDAGDTCNAVCKIGD